MNRLRGFTLIELMIVVVVIGILSAIAYPSYIQFVQRSNRSAAEQLMMAISSREEMYVQDARAYTATIGTGGLNIAQQGWVCAATCGDGSGATGLPAKTYTITVTTVAGPPPGYFIAAVPTGSQTADGTLYFNASSTGTYSSGTKSRTAGDGKW